MSLWDPANAGAWTLTLNGTNCNTHAWFALDCHQLRPSVDRRGSSRTIPSVVGRKPRRARDDEVTEVLEVLFTGNVTTAGVAASDPQRQLQTNLRAFEAAVVDATGDANGCITATLAGSGVTYAGLVQIRKWRVGDGLTECSAALTLSIPAGRLAVTGS